MRAGGQSSQWRWRCMFLAAAFGVAVGAAGRAAGSTVTESADQFDWNKAREFWSFRAPRAHPLPEVRNKRWPRERVDSFVLATMEKRGLSPALEAERRVLIRRVTFDLTGLPPTPDEVRAFLADGRADAYEQVVDRLLASSGYGERMASLWLNVARYA